MDKHDEYTPILVHNNATPREDDARSARLTNRCLRISIGWGFVSAFLVGLGVLIVYAMRDELQPAYEFFPSISVPCALNVTDLGYAVSTERVSFQPVFFVVALLVLLCFDITSLAFKQKVHNSFDLCEHFDVIGAFVSAMWNFIYWSQYAGLYAGVSLGLCVFVLVLAPYGHLACGTPRNKTAAAVLCMAKQLAVHICLLISANLVLSASAVSKRVELGIVAWYVCTIIGSAQIGLRYMSREQTESDCDTVLVARLLSYPYAAIAMLGVMFMRVKTE